LSVTHKSSAGHGRLGQPAGKAKSTLNCAHKSFVSLRRSFLLLLVCPAGQLELLLGKGWPRHQVNCPVPLKARPGWFVQLPIIGGLNQPPRHPSLSALPNRTHLPNNSGACPINPVLPVWLAKPLMGVEGFCLRGL